MPHINLLPWRDTLKKEREIRFGIIAGVSLFLSGLVVLGVHLFMDAEITYQKKRNDYLNSEIKKAEAKIEKIKMLDEKKQDMIARMNAIQDLEESRPLVVHLFEELVTQVPNGVYFTSMKQKDDKVILEGVAQSDARVSSLMKKIDESEWLTLPKIYIIKSKENKKDKKRSVSTFKLEVTQETLQEEKKP
jgi:type IV pilus assembly protein PilN